MPLSTLRDYLGRLLELRRFEESERILGLTYINLLVG